MSLLIFDLNVQSFVSVLHLSGQNNHQNETGNQPLVMILYFELEVITVCMFNHSEYIYLCIAHAKTTKNCSPLLHRWFITYYIKLIKMQYDMSNLLKSCKILCNFSIPVWYKSKAQRLHKNYKGQCVWTSSTNISSTNAISLDCDMLNQ